jgi:hypothetical protein
MYLTISISNPSGDNTSSVIAEIQLWFEVEFFEFTVQAQS